MLHRENHSASLCRLNQKPLPLHPSPSAGTMCGDTPECDCTCLRLCCVVWKWKTEKRGEEEEEEG